MNSSVLIYDWNNVFEANSRPITSVQLLDETLRDGLQSPSAYNPSIAKKIKILDLMEDLGINMVNIGLPGAGPRAIEHATALAKEIGTQRLRIRPVCGARTHESDIRPIASISQKAGIPIEAALFIGCSPIRRYTEGWTDDFIFRTTEQNVKYAVSLGLDVAFVTEDTTRCDPEMLKGLYKTAIANGAKAIVVCDTCGHATPEGTTRLIRFILKEIVSPSKKKVRVDWHGHGDRGLALPNALAALSAGVDCLHGCGLGIGERVGNTQMDQLLMNLKLMGIEPWSSQDLSNLKVYCSTISRATHVPIPRNYPVFGKDAFCTGTGVHAAAVIKALRKNDIELADRIYSGVPAHFFGMEQIIEVGPMSGKSNITFWLEHHGFPLSDEVIECVYQFAKRSNRIVTSKEILACLNDLSILKKDLCPNDALASEHSPPRIGIRKQKTEFASRTPS